jgi:hypothetical protein
MGNVEKPVGHETRLAPEYSEARSLLEEKRGAMSRVAEIDHTLRELSKEEPDLSGRRPLEGARKTNP